ncbi:helix-turn-helix transcriptional regulator [Bacillus sp. V59.32b]|uniref:ArsR/SmtB family transcription factor n=1 Tax=Bacillus sp. V59.32b TaxID=1758642 RepID=UPI000E3C5C2A|nr:winged helix-turn-helix domain-containing protein [Bacillus sp. V59.32b]RFU61186.1 ArsR family transcriptional regulator [Bacillus sp. V59.32b]
MSINQNVANIAALISEYSRSAILTVLMDGRFHTASELSFMIGITPQTISYHLSKLVEGNIIAVEGQGRHRYFGIQNQEVAQIMEYLLAIAPPVEIKSLRQSREDNAIRIARTCYDHIAGNLGVKITDSLIKKNVIKQSENEFVLSIEGEHFLNDFQIKIEDVIKKRRSFCHKCLDWSERRHHLAGALGNALLERFLELQWISRSVNSRALIITPHGKKEIQDKFSIEI